MDIPPRVVAKKIVSELRFSLSRSLFFTSDLDQNFSSPIFCNALNAGPPNFGFTRWQMQYTERENDKQDFISITLLVIVALILKVVGNLFQTFHLHVLIQMITH